MIQKLLLLSNLVSIALTCISIIDRSYSKLKTDQITFNTWATDNSRSYRTNSDRQQRSAIFQKNKAFIDSFNADRRNTFQLGLNAFSDWTDEELNSRLMRARPAPEADVEEQSPNLRREKRQTAPTSWDWRQWGVVSPVKDQGPCGSCYAFGALATVEAHYYIKYHYAAGVSPASQNSLNYAEQQILDCSWSYNNGGCDGGLEVWSFDYLYDYGGSNSETQYLYTALSSTNCRALPADKNAPLAYNTTLQRPYEVVRTGSDAEMIKALSRGPVNIGFAVGPVSRAFNSYKTGVFSCKSKPKYLDHAMVVVGYTPTYWIVKNSWGTTWGMSGYIHIVREARDRCCVLCDIVYPLIN